MHVNDNVENGFWKDLARNWPSHEKCLAKFLILNYCVILVIPTRSHVRRGLSSQCRPRAVTALRPIHSICCQIQFIHHEGFHCSLKTLAFCRNYKYHRLLGMSRMPAININRFALLGMNCFSNLSNIYGQSRQHFHEWSIANSMIAQ